MAPKLRERPTEQRQTQQSSQNWIAAQEPLSKDWFPRLPFLKGARRKGLGRAGSSHGGLGRRDPIRTGVEPKLLHRRRQVADESRRRKLQLIKIVGAVLTALLIVVGLLFSPLFDIDHMVVTGQSHLTEADVEASSSLEHGTALVAADLEAAVDRLRSNPWIAFATTRRSYPGTVLIDITEERPVLVLRTPKGSALVSENGRIVDFEQGSGDQDAPASATDYETVVADFDGRIVEAATDEGPALTGQRVSGEVEALVRLARHMTYSVRQRLSALQSGPGDDVTLLLDDGSAVVFGRVEDVAAKLSAVEAVLEQVDLECLAEIDVRNPTRATVTRSEGCSLEEQ